MRKNALLFLFLSLVITSKGQLSLVEIPDSLLQTENPVIRRYATDIKVINKNRIDIAENVVVTLIDKAELEHFTVCFIQNNNKVNKYFIKKAYDMEGKKLKNVNVLALQNGGCTKLQLEGKNGEVPFPISVELEYKTSIGSIDELNTWLPVPDYGISVQNASIRISTLDSTVIAKGFIVLQPSCKTIDEDGFIVTLWELNGFVAEKRGSSNELPQNIFPWLKITRRE